MKPTNKNKQLYLALPVIGLPFIAILFWALGGSQGTPAQGSAMSQVGLNPELPRAHFQDALKTLDKLAVYEKALHDSLAEQEAKKNDPYFRFSTLTELQEQQRLREAEQNKYNASLGTKGNSMEQNEQQVQERLTQLYKAINVPPENSTPMEKPPAPITPDQQRFTGDVDRLENMMVSMNGGHEENPELKQMDTMLEKILDIQHPERVAEKIQEKKLTQQKKALPVNIIDPNASITFLSTDSLHADSSSSKNVSNALQNDFFGLNDASSMLTQQSNVIEAVIHDTQTLVAGAIVKLRLTKPIEIKGNSIPENTFVYGVSEINGERLTISITSIRYDNLLLPITLAVYDLDGMAGVYIPGAIERDAAKQSTSQSLQQMQLMSSVNQSIGAQAAGAGIEAAKGLFSKKIKLVKVTVKAGYQVLLQDPNQSNK